MKKWLILACVVVFALAITYAVWPDAELANRPKAETDEERKIGELVRDEQDNIFPLNIRNAKIDFACAKDVAGKTLVVRGGWDPRFSSDLSGQIVTDAEHKNIKRVEATVQVDTLWSQHEELTKALLNKGFFQVNKYSTSVFIADLIEPIEAEEAETPSASDSNGESTHDTPPPTHTVTGNLKINGITKSIRFPAHIALEQGRVLFDAAFSLNRKDFDVKFDDAAVFGTLTDENIHTDVNLRIHVDAKFDTLPPQSEVNPTVLEVHPDAIEIDLAALPKHFTDRIAATQVEFDMVKVPGDPDKGIETFYIGKCEVTWNEYAPWASGEDLADDVERAIQMEMKLRPSRPYGAIDRGFGMRARPALGMTRNAAEVYCRWLSSQTGRNYRLPTEQEWEHAYRLGIGNPSQPLEQVEADRLVISFENSFDDDVNDWATQPVASREPDRLGLHDLAGNVAEWVAGSPSQRVVRGGSFLTPRDAIGVERLVEPPAWANSNPQGVKSIWWIKNPFFQGFRVVCEVPEP